MWFKKNQKNGKPAHGGMVCDALSRKNTKHGVSMFCWGILHKFCHQAGDHLSFYPRELGKCKIHSKLSNLELIFCRVLHIWITNNFLNNSFLACHNFFWIWVGTSAQIAQNGCFLGKASAEDMENFRIMNPSSAGLVHISIAYNFANYCFLFLLTKIWFFFLIVAKWRFFVKWLPKLRHAIPPLHFS